MKESHTTHKAACRFSEVRGASSETKSGGSAAPKHFTWKVTRIISVFLTTLCLLFATLATPIAAEAGTAQAIQSTQAEAPFELTMLNVGQGLSLLIKADGKYMIYDGGGRSSSSYVVSYLKQHGVTELTYLTASHYDEDHIAGLVGVLNTTKVDTVLCPDYTTDTKIYQSFLTKEQASGAQIIHPRAGDTYALANASISVLSADNSAETDNDRSIALRIAYGSFSVIMTGDAAEEEEAKILRTNSNLDSDLYIAGHHGSQYSSSTAFLNAVTPAYTFISCGAGNSYGHPTKDALDRIIASGSQLYRSDVQGEVTVYSDGTSYWFSQAPTKNLTPGTGSEGSSAGAGIDATSGTAVGSNATGSGTVTSAYSTAAGLGIAAAGDAGTSASQNASRAAGTYILNTRSKKFHYPSCDSVKKMSEKNKQVSTKSRDQLILEGYDPCQNCNP